MHSRNELRKLLLGQRKALTSEQCQKAADQLLIQFKDWFETLNLQTPKHPILNIAGYLSIGGEIDLQPTLSYLRSRDHVTYVPIIKPEQQGRLLFAHVDDATEFQTGKFKIQEPIYREQDLLHANSIDLVLVPLVGADKNGNRLGMGGGFYDRTFSDKLISSKSTKSPILVGVCHAFQTIDTVPTEEWDVPLDALITDRTIVKKV